VGLGEVLELEVTQPGLGQLQAVAVAALGTRAEVTAIVQPLIDGLGQGDLGALDQRPPGKIGDDLGPLGPSFLHGAERVAPARFGPSRSGDAGLFAGPDNRVRLASPPGAGRTTWSWGQRDPAVRATSAQTAGG
jgi:hypothetical protein